MTSFWDAPPSPADLVNKPPPAPADFWATPPNAADLIQGGAPAMPSARDASRFDTRNDPNIHANIQSGVNINATPKETPGMLETAMRSAGHLGGWGDKLTAAVEALALPDKAALSEYTPSKIAGRYEKFEGDRQAKYREARDAHPFVSVPAETVSMLPLALATGGASTAGQVVGQGMAWGAATGLGESRGDLKSMEGVGQLAEDTTTGGILGGATAGVLHGVGVGAGAVKDMMTRRSVPSSTALQEHLFKIFDSPMGAREATERTAAGYKKMLEAGRAEYMATGDEGFGIARAAAGDMQIPTPKAALADPSLPKQMTLDELQTHLSDFSAGSKGSGNAFVDAAQAKAKRLTRVTYTAIQEDLANAAGSPGQLGEAGRALVKARSDYATGAQAFRAQKDTLLERALSKVKTGAPETYPQTLLGRAVGAEQLKKTMGTVRAIDPATADGLATSAVNDLLKKQVVQGGGVSPSGLVALDKTHGKHIQALLYGNDAAISNYNKVVKVAQMFGGDKGPALERWFGPLIRSPYFKTPALMGVGVGVYTSPSAAFSAVGLYKGLDALSKKFTEANIARMLTDPEAGALLLGLMRPKPGMTMKQATAMTARLAAILEAKNAVPQEE